MQRWAGPLAYCYCNCYINIYIYIYIIILFLRAHSPDSATTSSQSHARGHGHAIHSNVIHGISLLESDISNNSSYYKTYSIGIEYIILMSSASGRLELKCQQAIYPQPLGGPPGPRLSTNDFSLEAVFLEIECTSTLARAQTLTYIFNIDIYLSDIYYIKINGHWWNLCNSSQLLAYRVPTC